MYSRQWIHSRNARTVHRDNDDGDDIVRLEPSIASAADVVVKRRPVTSLFYDMTSVLSPVVDDVNRM